MLVLSRKNGERIVIVVNNQVIHLEVLDLSARKVKLGIAAPEEVTVYREEVWHNKSEFSDDVAADCSANIES